jgi:hypothetical protein
LRVVERVLNRGVRVAASTLCVLLPFSAASLVLPSLDAVPLLTIVVTIVTVLLTLGWLASLQALRDVDVTFWRAVWTGEAGRLAFAAAKRLRGAVRDRNFNRGGSAIRRVSDAITARASTV